MLLQWWPGTLHSRDPSITDGERRVSYVILYDPDHSAGYPDPTEHRVTFLEEHELYDMEHDDFLAWRFEGQEWDAQAVDDRDDAIDKEWEKYRKVAGLSQTTSAMDVWKSSVGRQLEHLPPDIQQIMAEKVSRGMDIFVEELKSVIGESKDDVSERVVTTKDITDVLERFNRRIEGGD